MTETTARIRWEDSLNAPGEPAFKGHVAALDDVFRIWPPEDPGDEWWLSTWLPGLAERQLYGFPIDLKREAERWLEEFVTSLGAIFPEPGTAQVAIEEEERPAPYFDEHDLAVIAAFDDDEDGEPLEVKYAAGRRVRYASPGAGYPGEAAHAAASLVLGEVYTIGWADIGQSRTDLNLYRDGESMGRFNSVFFELADDEPEAKTATAGEETGP